MNNNFRESRDPRVTRDLRVTVKEVMREAMSLFSEVE